MMGCENREIGPNVVAIQKAYTDAGKPVPEEYRTRLAGARDVK